ncbi:hypothetical protein LguiA_031992 [Lonicera macranthoides]
MDAACALCQRILSSDNEAGDLEAISICGDCKFLYLEDIGTPIHDVQRRATRVRRGRRTYSSSESAENIFSQEFSNIINLARQSQPSISEHESQSVDGNATAMLVQPSSSRTTPSGSRRWRRVLSDTESDGFDSLYGESDSNVSFSGYRLFHGENDTISFSAYGGDSDASVDGHSLVDNDIFGHPDAESDLDSDSDIDPMHAGLSQWNSDDQEEEDEDNEWEEADEEIAGDSTGMVVDLRRSLNSTESNAPRNWHRQFHTPHFEGTIRLGIRERRRQTRIPDIFANLAESELHAYAGNSGDYLDARGFEELLENLAEGDNSRRGAPPASVSFVNRLPRVVINEEHWKQDSLACAVCKDFLCIGTVVNQLPCFHVYHPSCILPWLSARNSCPLCRYELPTDDKEYEDGKHRSRNRMEEIEQQVVNDDSLSETSDGGEEVEACEFSHGSRTREELNVAGGGENGRGRWLYLAAAPIVSLVGIVLVLWLGNPLTERRGSIGRSHLRGQHLDHSSGLCPHNPRENRSRRWWSLF